MKKSALILFSISLCALISMLTISPVQADIERFTWLPPYMQKDGGVVVFKDGSAVNLIVPVENDWYLNGLNVLVSKRFERFESRHKLRLGTKQDFGSVGQHRTS
jgi:hypothetical protein